MIQRVQTLWMALTVAMVCVVIFSSVASFSAAGEASRIMSYGIEYADRLLVVDGAEAGGQTITSPLSLCTAALLGLSALVPFVTIFLYRKRALQARLLGAEFALLVGSAGMMAWYILSTKQNVLESMSVDFFFSLFPLLLVVAMLTNWFAIRGVLRDEIMVRAADRIR